jgi:hypothetical protein
VQIKVIVAQQSEVVEYFVRCPSQRAACPSLSPPPACPNSCSSPNGVCKATVNDSFVCACSKGWSGADCSTYECDSTRCPLANTLNGNNGTVLHGSCVAGECECHADYTGIDCRFAVPKCKTDCTLQVTFSRCLLLGMAQIIMHDPKKQSALIQIPWR